jgi:hypothetical protein
MNTKELRERLLEMEYKYPHRELTVEAHNDELRIRVAMGNPVFGPPDPTRSLGRGVGSQWVKILIPYKEDPGFPQPKTFEEKAAVSETRRAFMKSLGLSILLVDATPETLLFPQPFAGLSKHNCELFEIKGISRFPVYNERGELSTTSVSYVILVNHAASFGYTPENCTYDEAVERFIGELRRWAA